MGPEALRSGLLVIRADASPSIGAGHLMRCLALAQAWQAEGGRAVLLSRCQSDILRQRVADGGVECVAVPYSHPDVRDLYAVREYAGSVAARGVVGAVWLTLDGYHFDSAYQEAVRCAGYRLLVIDDMAHLPRYHADVLLNQNVGADALAYRTPSETRRLLGPRYALLRSEFQICRDRRREGRAQSRRLLVTLGGSDPQNVTRKVIDALAHAPPCEARIIVGPSNPHADALVHAAMSTGPGCVVLHDVTDMPAMMRWADVAISAAGSTCWELAFMGVPTAVVVVAGNQQGVAEGLAREGAAVNLGWHEDVSANRIGQALTDLLDNASLREMLAANARSLVDGEGADRVVAEMRGQPLRLRRAVESDCRRLWEWANDRTVRAVSFVPDPIPWETHVAWFAGKLHDLSVQIYVAITRDENPIGQVRFELDGTDATVSASLARRFRGMGLGSIALDMATRRFFRACPSVQVVHAYIQPGNEHSVRAFMKAGFTHAARTTVRGQPALHLVRRRCET